MARTTIPYVKTRFETGDRPTQEDYIDLIDTATSQATDLGSFGNNNENTVAGIENATVVDSFDATVWRMVKYLVSISKTSAGDNKFYATELTILVDGADISVSEYGTIDNDGNMGTISVSRTGDTVALTVTPDSVIKPVTVRFARMGLKA
jgi:hypothetical protein